MRVDGNHRSSLLGWFFVPGRHRSATLREYWVEEELITRMIGHWCMTVFDTSCIMTEPSLAVSVYQLP